MSIFNKIKSAIGGSKKPEKTAQKKIKPKKSAKEILPQGSSKPEKENLRKSEPVKPLSVKKNFKDVYRILSEPHISEKATYLSDGNKYVFKVFKKANKIQIKNAVRGLYGVGVKDVKIVNQKSKSRKLKNISGRKSGYKKAVVTLEKGYKIEILPH